MNKIKKHRQRKNMSAEYVARALGVSRQTIINWEGGETEPSASHIRALSKLFGVSADELLKEEK